MAVKIKLKRLGKMRDPHYRIVVADARTKRDGRAIEEIGQYHPKSNPSVIEVNSERVQYWLGVGAQPTGPVAAILRVTGDWQKFRGEPEPEPMKRPEPKPDRRAVFEAAAKEAAGEAKQSDKDADKGRAGARKSAAKKTSAKKASPPKADEAKADEVKAGEGKAGSDDTAQSPAVKQGGSDEPQASDQPAKG